MFYYIRFFWLPVNHFTFFIVTFFIRGVKNSDTVISIQFDVVEKKCKKRVLAANKK